VSIKVTVDEKSKTATIQFLQKILPEEINRILYDSLDYFMRLLANTVKLKLSGPVLKVQTGRLRSSILTQLIPEPPKLIGEIGTNVVYAPIHEFGGTVIRGSHIRISSKGKSFIVTAHTATYPERSYLRSSLNEEFPKLAQIIERQLTRALANA
jgi:phage gpG-like protein